MPGMCGATLPGLEASAGGEGVGESLAPREHCESPVVCARPKVSRALGRSLDFGALEQEGSLKTGEREGGMLGRGLTPGERWWHSP